MNSLPILSCLFIIYSSYDQGFFLITITKIMIITTAAEPEISISCSRGIPSLGKVEFVVVIVVFDIVTVVVGSGS